MYIIPKEQQELVNLFKLVKKYANMRTYNNDCKNIQVKINENQITFTFTNGYFLVNKVLDIKSDLKKSLIVYMTPNLFDFFLESPIEKIEYDNENKCLIFILKNGTKIAIYKNKHEIITNTNVTTLNYSIDNYPNIEQLQNCCQVSETHFTIMLNVKELIDLLQACESEKLYVHIDIFNQLAPIFLTNPTNNTQMLVTRFNNNNNNYNQINLKLFDWLSKGQIEECKERQKQNTTDTPDAPTNQ
jgi:hypothetical protein